MLIVLRNYRHFATAVARANPCLAAPAFRLVLPFAAVPDVSFVSPSVSPFADSSRLTAGRASSFCRFRFRSRFAPPCMIAPRPSGSDAFEPCSAPVRIVLRVHRSRSVVSLRADSPLAADRNGLPCRAIAFQPGCCACSLSAAHLRLADRPPASRRMALAGPGLPVHALPPFTFARTGDGHDCAAMSEQTVTPGHGACHARCRARPDCADGLLRFSPSRLRRFVPHSLFEGTNPLKTERERTT
jgi:hypothetical protein